MGGAAMIEMRRVLCPVDFSETSRHALEHALAVARWYEARVTVLHVIHPLLVLDPPVLFVEASREPELADVGSMHVRLRQWLDAANAPGDVDIAVDEGNPVGRILRHAASLPADLIVMGTHGRSGFDRFAMGSVAEKVLRKAGCPVVTVPPPAIATSVVPFKRILCPVDFSESSLASLRFAFSLAKESDARLTVLHAVEWPSDEADVVEHVFNLPDLRRQLEKDSNDRLASLIPADVRQWCQPVTKVVFGRPHVTILNIATEERADLIVMGVRGRSAMDLTLFGSTTNQVVRRANCPVLTLRPKT
jgi:nucleotide-binding universal stress UspA family protein